MQSMFLDHNKIKTKKKKNVLEIWKIPKYLIIKEHTFK